MSEIPEKRCMYKISTFYLIAYSLNYLCPIVDADIDMPIMYLFIYMTCRYNIYILK